MPFTRRSFTFGSTFAFLTGTGAHAQDTPSLPDCEPKAATSGIWQVRSTLTRGPENKPLGFNRYIHQGDIWVFRRTTPGDDWTHVGEGARLTFEKREDATERADGPVTRLSMRFERQFTNETGAETALIPFALGATELTVNLTYFVDVSRAGARERIAEGERTTTFRADTGSHGLRFNLPDDALSPDTEQLFFGAQFSDNFGIGAIADISGLEMARVEGDRLTITAKREVAAGFCAVPAPTGGCFVVTAAHEAGQENSGKPVDLDLILAARDDLLASMPQYRPSANQYYDTAPELVRRIGQSNHRHDIYARFVRRAVRPAEWFIRRGLPRLGFVWLGIGIEVLYKRHLPDVDPPSAFAPGRRAKI